MLRSLGRGVPPQGIRKPLGKSKCGLIFRKTTLHNQARFARTMRERVSESDAPQTHDVARWFTGEEWAAWARRVLLAEAKER